MFSPPGPQLTAAECNEFMSCAGRGAAINPGHHGTIHDSTALTNLQTTALLRLQRHSQPHCHRQQQQLFSGEFIYIPNIYLYLTILSCLVQVRLVSNIEVHIVALVTGDEALESAKEAAVAGSEGQGSRRTC